MRRGVLSVLFTLQLKLKCNVRKLMPTDSINHNIVHGT